MKAWVWTKERVGGGEAVLWVALNKREVLVITHDGTARVSTNHSDVISILETRTPWGWRRIV